MDRRASAPEPLELGTLSDLGRALGRVILSTREGDLSPRAAWAVTGALAHLARELRGEAGDGSRTVVRSALMLHPGPWCKDDSLETLTFLEVEPGVFALLTQEEARRLWAWDTDRVRRGGKPVRLETDPEIRAWWA